ncbi:MAG: nucleotidyltransferase domain-containing protein [Firmicutes bacterium]|jgi:predicted nucleotidyltransferase|nr:nucleotidyltransferase domain-containing protein [Bacillota bacterium]
MTSSASDQITDIAEKYNLRLLVYFGSYMTESYSEESDIDIAYLAEKPLNTAEKLGLLRELIVTHRKSEVDLVDLQTADPLLRYEIATSGRPFYEREKGLFEQLSLFYIKQIYELKPVIRERIKTIRREIQELITDGDQGHHLRET